MSNFKISDSDIVLCAIEKGESPYIEEWLKWNLDKVRFDKVYLFNNDGNDEISRMPYLEELQNDGKLHVERYDVSDSPQVGAYKKFYMSYRPSWVMFLDIDEYLCIPFPNIHDYIDSFTNKHRDCVSIGFPWEMYGDSGHIYMPKGNLMDNFTIPFTKEDANKRIELKTILRGGLKDFGMPNPHTTCVEWQNGTPYYSFGEPKKNNGSLNDDSFSPIIYSGGKIKHFWTKSAEEFVSKVMRGRATIKRRRNIDEYFNINPRTKDREETINRFVREYEARS